MDSALTSPVSAVAPPAPHGAGGVVRRFAFRCGVAYLWIYCLPFPVDTIYGPLGRPWQAMWEALIPWLAKLLFGMEIVYDYDGSGDTTYHYGEKLGYLVLALLIGLVWSFFDRARRWDPTVSDWTRAYVRCLLGVVLLLYGTSKVIPSQFAANDLTRLLQPFGDASPMGLFWAFMGHSAPYQVFSGVLEVVAGLLLWSRRTSTLGALVALGVLSNVVMLNLCYDVPAKLSSSHLLLISLYLLAPDARRLAGLFFGGARVALTPPVNLFSRPRWHRGMLVLRALLFLWVIYDGSVYSWNRLAERNARFADAPYPGLWEVQEFSLGGVVRPLVINDPEVWRRLRFRSPSALSIQDMSGAWGTVDITFDAAARRIEVLRRRDGAALGHFEFQEAGPDELTLAGELGKRQIALRLKRVEPEFLLTTRGFHWVNEYPFNR